MKAFLRGFGTTLIFFAVILAAAKGPAPLLGVKLSNAWHRLFGPTDTTAVHYGDAVEILTVTDGKVTKQILVRPQP